MSTKDVIKKSILAGFNESDISAAYMVTILIFAILAGLYVYLIYRLSTRSSLYNSSFNKALATMPVITAGIMLAMQSNLIISLGMVGALSIVRFRNAVKDSSDLMFLFWSISLGIITGTGLFELAIILSLCISLLIFCLDLIPNIRSSWVLVISCSKEAKDKDIADTVKKYSSRAQMRSHNVSASGSDWVYELRCKDGGSLIKNISAVPGVVSANLMNHDGDVRY